MFFGFENIRLSIDLILFLAFLQNQALKNYFEFYYNGNLITGRSDIYGFEGVRCIGKYYKVEFSSENTNYSNILLDKEIIDSLEIINSGFKLN